MPIFAWNFRFVWVGMMTPKTRLKYLCRAYVNAKNAYVSIGSLNIKIWRCAGRLIGAKSAFSGRLLSNILSILLLKIELNSTKLSSRYT